MLEPFQSTPPVKAATIRATVGHYTDGFQSTPPVKAATSNILANYRQQVISIHAAREGGDHTLGKVHSHSTAFQSTPPVKAATIINIRPRRGICVFQSTPPVKAATSRLPFCDIASNISIHAAREGGDGTGTLSLYEKIGISIHAAREGGDHVSIEVSNLWQ